jgi:hypothetical protein
MASNINLPPAVKIGGGLALLGFGTFLGVKAWRNYQNKKQASDILRLQKVSNVKGINALGKPVSVNLTTIAADIYDSFHSSFDEDEARAIRAFKNAPVTQIRKLSEIYQKIYGYNLQDDMRKYLSDTEFMQVKFFFK